MWNLLHRRVSSPEKQKGHRLGQRVITTPSILCWSTS
jgi:hypothetical protein